MLSLLYSLRLQREEGYSSPTTCDKFVVVSISMYNKFSTHVSFSKEMFSVVPAMYTIPIGTCLKWTCTSLYVLGFKKLIMSETCVSVSLG